MNWSAQKIWLPGLLLAVAVAGCTSAHYRTAADRAAYGAIRQKSPAVKNMDPAFTIEQTNAVELANLPVVTNAVDYLGRDGEAERGASRMRLEDALRIAIHHSRSYQSRKEQLYLSALSLTLARHQFTPIFSAGGSAAYKVTATESPALSDHFVEDRSVSASGDVGGSWLIRDVGRITTAFTTDFLRFVSGDPRLATSSKLSATFVRPLWRDAGFKQQMESLTQAERDLLYALRDFSSIGRISAWESHPPTTMCWATATPCATAFSICKVRAETPTAPAHWHKRDGWPARIWAARNNRS